MLVTDGCERAGVGWEGVRRVMLILSAPSLVRGSGLDKYLDKQGFSLVGYGCTTCIGNSGDLHEDVAEAIAVNGMLSLYDVKSIFRSESGGPVQ